MRGPGHAIALFNADVKINGKTRDANEKHDSEMMTQIHFSELEFMSLLTLLGAHQNAKQLKTYRKFQL